MEQAYPKVFNEAITSHFTEVLIALAADLKIEIEVGPGGKATKILDPKANDYNASQANKNRLYYGRDPTQRQAGQRKSWGEVFGKNPTYYKPTEDIAGYEYDGNEARKKYLEHPPAEYKPKVRPKGYYSNLGQRLGYGSKVKKAMEKEGSEISYNDDGIPIGANGKPLRPQDAEPLGPPVVDPSEVMFQ
jgi:hypothetical protein